MIVLKCDKIYLGSYINMIKFIFAQMLWKPDCEQLTLIQSDISPIDIALYL